MVFIILYLGAMVGLMIYAIIVLRRDGQARKAYEAELGHKVKNNEWRAYKKENVVRGPSGKGKPKTAKMVPVKTKILDHTSGAMKGGGGGVGRAIIGGAIAGPAGAIVGAGTRKQKFTQNHIRCSKCGIVMGTLRLRRCHIICQSIRSIWNYLKNDKGGPYNEIHTGAHDKGRGEVGGAV